MSSLRGKHQTTTNNISDENSNDIKTISSNNVKDSEFLGKPQERNLATSTHVETHNGVDIGIGEISKKKRQRKLAASAFARLFQTPVAQWTLSQWALLFVIIWLFGYFMRRCTCLYDILACYCCYEIFCDPDPVGFVAC